MATIVYEGVGGGGNLFAGTKFFFVQRLPARQRWMELVESNGGEIVKLDKLADVIIADHARKDCPPGSISWTYIERSAKKGRLENIEDHRAGRAGNTGREVGSGQPTRTGRTPFTAEDDRILTEWVLRAEHKGVSTKGNELYRQLEEKNNRHTLQSWRDRWIKILQYRPRSEIPEFDDHELEGPLRNKYTNGQHTGPSPRRPASNNESISSPSSRPEEKRESRKPVSRPAAASSRATVSNTSAKSVAKNSPQASPKITLAATSVGATNFEEEDAELLIGEYDAIMDLSEEVVLDAWDAWAAEYPKHTAEEWRNYFSRTIVPRVLKAKAQETEKPKSSPEARQPSKPVPPSQSVEREVPAAKSVGSQRTPQKVVDPSTTDERLFKEDLLAMAKLLGVQVDLNPVICGRTIPLFKLWQVVKSDDFGGYDEVTGRGLWTQVARKLNFNDFKHSGAPKLLAECYGLLLADFEVEREAYIEQTESQDEAMINDQLLATAALETEDSETEQLGGGLETAEGKEEEEEEEDDFNDDLDAPPSASRQSPLSSSAKRRFDSGRKINAGESPPTYNKRQRIDKGKEKAEPEIPATPEETIKGSQKIQPSHKLSPLNYSSWNADEAEIENGLPRRLRDHISITKLGAPNLEPETQDFNFPIDDDDEARSLFSKSSPSHLRNPRLRTPHPSKLSDAREESSTQSHPTTDNEIELQAFIDHFEALGYPHEIVVEAIEATTYTKDDAPHVMEELASGRGIPENIAGVWTAKDDVALDVGGTEMEMVVKKHGMERVSLRQEYHAKRREILRELKLE